MASGLVLTTRGRPWSGGHDRKVTCESRQPTDEKWLYWCWVKCRKRRGGNKVMVILLEITEAARSISRAQRQQKLKIWPCFEFYASKTFQKEKKDITQWQDEIRYAQSSQPIREMWQQIKDVINYWRGAQRGSGFIPCREIFNYSGNLTKVWKG